MNEGEEQTRVKKKYSKEISLFFDDTGREMISFLFSLNTTACCWQFAESSHSDITIKVQSHQPVLSGRLYTGTDRSPSSPAIFIHICAS